MHSETEQNLNAQAKSEGSLKFSERTDALAAALGGLNTASLGKFIGMSHESLSGYRTGRLPISAKAWRKLEVAEIKAGLRYGQIPGRIIQEIPTDKQAGAARHTGMVSESSPSDPTHSWDDVVSYVRTLKQLDLTPDEVIELLQREYPLRLGKKS